MKIKKIKDWSTFYKILSLSLCTIVFQVAGAIEEQSPGSEQIGKNIDSINAITQESSAGVQEIAKSTEDLNRLMMNLQNLIQRFTIQQNGIYYTDAA